jgi:WD40 repeat protein
VPASPHSRGPIRSLSFSPDGSLLAAADALDGVTVWESAVERARQIFRVRDESLQTVTFAADGQTLIGTKISGTLQLWDIAAAGERVVHRGKRGIYLSAFAPGGHTLAAVCDDSIVRVWNMTTVLHDTTHKQNPASKTGTRLVNTTR